MSWYGMLCSNPWEACHFQNGIRRMDRERKDERQGSGQEERKKEKLWSICKINLKM